MQKRKKFDLNACFAEAARYANRSSFVKGSPASYHALWRTGLLDEACSHMTVSTVYIPPKWTHDAVFREAAKYRNRAEFKRESGGAHSYAISHGIMNQACAHMREGQNFWHVFELMAVAIKYRDKSAFIKAESSAYNYCCNAGLIDLACAHMSQRGSWDRSSVMTEAAKYRSRSAFQACSMGAYNHAHRNGFLDEACAHMPPPEYGFSKEKPAHLYQLRITTIDGLELFKLGITNRSPMERVAGMGLPSGAVVEVLDTIVFDRGRDARITEKRLHRKFSSFRYVGPPLMKNGNTELFTVKLLGQE